MRKMKRGQWIAAVFGLALAGTLTFGVTFDAKAAGRSLIAGEWINMEGGPASLLAVPQSFHLHFSTGQHPGRPPY